MRREGLQSLAPNHSDRPLTDHVLLREEPEEEEEEDEDEDENDGKDDADDDDDDDDGYSE